MKIVAKIIQKTIKIKKKTSKISIYRIMLQMRRVNFKEIRLKRIMVRVKNISSLSLYLIHCSV